MYSWNDLPVELLGKIFQYLPRRERLSITLVCKTWREALDQIHLWKTTTILLDKDLIESSTVILLKIYHKHIKYLELGFSFARKPMVWCPQKFEEITKRACRFLIILNDLNAQINGIKLFDWCEGYRFKKIIYQLSRLLKKQANLNEVVFQNTNLHKEELLRIVRSCIFSKHSITYLCINNHHIHHQSGFDSVHFLSCLDHFSNLNILRMDYAIFSRGVVDCIITSQNHRLFHIHLTICETDTFGQAVTEEQWMTLTKLSPELKVSLIIKNICHFEEIHFFLKQNIPLMSFALMGGKVWNQFKTRNYRKTLGWLLKHYKDSLVNIQIKLVQNRELLDDLIVNIFKNCPLLQNFEFQGVVENLDLIRELCKHHVEKKSNDSGTKYLSVAPKTFFLEDHVTLSKIYYDYSSEFLKKNFEFKTLNDTTKNYVYIYY